MKKVFESMFNDILVANKNGDVRNLLITDGNGSFSMMHFMHCVAGLSRIILTSWNLTRGIPFGSPKFSLEPNPKRKRFGWVRARSASAKQKGHSLSVLFVLVTRTGIEPMFSA